MEGKENGNIRVGKEFMNILDLQLPLLISKLPTIFVNYSLGNESVLHISRFE